MTNVPSVLELYDFELSGHCHRVRLLLSMLKLRHKVIPVDLSGGEHKSKPFLQLNAFGQVPVLRDGDTVIADSNAILVYLATRYGDSSTLRGGPGCSGTLYPGAARQRRSDDNMPSTRPR